jgi:nucleoside-diphosphate-sugar epimerase
MATVLVTGGSGFIASHCILQLLAAGHTVRTTVRQLGRAAEVRTLLQADAVSVVQADLLADAGWADAVAGCSHVLHVASPFPADVPAHDDDLVVPAREGTLRVLRAARDAGVTRVVLTSSFAAIGYGHGPRTTPFDEDSWTDPGAPGLTAYTRSKAIAERAAWDFVAREGGSLELVAVNPVGVFGPVLSRDFSSSIELLRQLLLGKVPALPRLYFGVVDVRDVADLHLRAMTHAAAKGERFLCAAGDFLSLREIGEVLRRRLGPAARRVPRRELPDFVVRVAARFSKQIAQALPELGRYRNASSAKARRVLGWAPRSNEEAIVAAAEGLLRLGLVSP